MSFRAEYWSKIHSTNGLERLNSEVKRRTEVVGISPGDDAIVGLVGAILLGENDEWARPSALAHDNHRDTVSVSPKG